MTVSQKHLQFWVKLTLKIKSKQTRMKKCSVIVDIVPRAIGNVKSSAVVFAVYEIFKFLI